MQLPWRLKFGVFMAPFHPVGDHPGLALERGCAHDPVARRVALRSGLDRRHHSAGWETIASPEVFIAWASATTSTIKLGCGARRTGRSGRIRKPDSGPASSWSFAAAGKLAHAPTTFS